MFDSNCMLRKSSSAGNVTGDEESAPYVRTGPDLEPQVIAIHVPNTVANCSLQVSIVESHDGVNPAKIHQCALINAAGTHYTTVKFNGPFKSYRIIQVGSNAGDWGAVDIGLVPGGRYTNH